MVGGTGVTLEQELKHSKNTHQTSLLSPCQLGKKYTEFGQSVHIHGKQKVNTGHMQLYTQTIQFFTY